MFISSLVLPLSFLVTSSLPFIFCFLSHSLRPTSFPSPTHFLEFIKKRRKKKTKMRAALSDCTNTYGDRNGGMTKAVVGNVDNSSMPSSPVMLTSSPSFGSSPTVETSPTAYRHDPYSMQQLAPQPSFDSYSPSPDYQQLPPHHSHPSVQNSHYSPQSLPRWNSSPQQMSDYNNQPQQNTTRPGIEGMVTVAFKYGRTECFGSDFEVKDGDYILVGGDRGIDLGRVISWSSETPDLQHRTKKAIRFASEEDLHLYFHVIPEKERAVAVEANDVVARYGMRMSVVHAEFQFDMNKVTLHYSSTESRIDWRPALAQLYRRFQCRLWFAQYNPQATPDPNLPLPSHPQQSVSKHPQQQIASQRTQQ
eukprot:TRINITY_DN3091_c0_g4_i1.p1 TRINITY_DN3091_c0_g4~~TRINITY_DN3091_c0_g4_i1.p1  ORF type:complete len:363 (+),score=62.68 TRINITY_DN3091_c0_g4_i1:372-1460(+)